MIGWQGTKVSIEGGLNFLGMWEQALKVGMGGGPLELTILPNHDSNTLPSYGNFGFGLLP